MLIKYTGEIAETTDKLLRPPFMADLVGWYRADDPVFASSPDFFPVDVLPDRSGHGNHLTSPGGLGSPIRTKAGGPHGRTAIYFDGIDDNLFYGNFGVLGLDVLTIFIGTQVLPATPVGAYIGGIFGPTFSVIHELRVDPFNATLMNARAGTGLFPAIGTTNVTVDWTLMGLRYNNNTGLVELIIGNAVEASNTDTGAVESTTEINFGSQGGFDFSEMFFAEALIYNSFISDQNLVAVYNYMRGRWL